LTISEMELQSQVDKIIEKKLLILLKGVFDA
ncbi:HK97 gp10 family phage protein, partial [Clostridioides difficile]|nr:HK97 gp10 family phage protein [Clostridioides difficile]EGT5411428.1 HK97 gp10 family phage protein [Clostridioides difficile]